MGMIIFCTAATMIPGGAMASNISENPPPFFNVQQTTSSSEMKMTTSNDSNSNSNNGDENNTTPPTSISRRPSAMTNSKYWDMVKSNDLSEVQFANERLMDHAIGTINTMYYDNTGGAKFNTKDMYDRWRVMKTYARDGIDGVRDMTRGSMGKDVTKSRLATKGETTTNGNGSDGLNNEDATQNKSSMFIPQLFLIDGDTVQVQKQHRYSDPEIETQKVPANAFNSRDDAVSSLKWLVSTLDDPYSKYLTRDELMRELKVRDDGFLGLGAVVEAPPRIVAAKSKNTSSDATSTTTSTKGSRDNLKKSSTITQVQLSPPSPPPVVTNSPSYLTSIRVSNLPMVTAIVPDSPAERAGIVVGDRIAAVGVDNFVGLGRDEILKKMTVYTGAENYIGQPDLTIAKPVKRSVSISIQDPNTSSSTRTTTTTSTVSSSMEDGGSNYDYDYDSMLDKEELIGYKLSRVRLPTTALEPFKPRSTQVSFPDVIPAASAADTDSQITTISGGDSIVHWELLTNKDSIFRKMTSSLGSTTTSTEDNDSSKNNNGGGVDRVGYIRLTRFSRASTAGYIKAVEELERAGAQSYIIDVRNNYGGIIQESMLTASSLLRDPHTVLCYTLNSRGGFTPHDVEEYVVDKRYPGYLLSSEPSNVSYEQVRREDPDFLTGNNWVPPSSYASLHEQKMKRNYNRPTGITAMMNPFQKRYNENLAAEEVRQLRAQKKIAILMNEGTASAAEVFVSSLRDNGRTVALVGTKTYGKGLIQHTFPMIDGGG